MLLAVSLAQMSLVRFFSGDLDSARSLAEEARAKELPGAFAGLSVAALLRIAAYSGDREKVSELLNQMESHFPIPGRANTIGAWSLMMGAVESLAMVAESGRAAKLYPLARELLESGAVCISFVCRFPQTIAGIAAGAAGEWEAAEQHFQVAQQQAGHMPHFLEQAEVRRFHSMMLLRRGLPGDRERAREMLVRAVESYDRIAMPRHRELARAMLAKAER